MKSINRSMGTNFKKEVKMSDKKVCGTCGEMKNLEDFSVSYNFKSGKGSKCKSCTNIYMKERRERIKKQLEEDRLEQ